MGSVLHPCITGRGITPLQPPSYQRPLRSQSLIPGPSPFRGNGSQHRAIEVGPFSFDFHVGFIEPPTPPHGTLPAAELLFKLRGILDNPAVERGMIDCHTPLAHHLLELPIRNRIGHVPSHAPQNDFSLELIALEVNHATTSTSLSAEEHSGK